MYLWREVTTGLLLPVSALSYGNSNRSSLYRDTNVATDVLQLGYKEESNTKSQEPKMTAMQTIKNKAASQSTDILIAALMLMDANGGPKTPADHMVQCAIGGTIQSRHGLVEAMDVLYWENAAAYARLTYSEALRLALIAQDVAQELGDVPAAA